MMAVDQDHSVQGSTVVAVIEEEPSGSTILGAMSTMSTVIAEQEKEQEMDGCRAKLAAATESKTESVPKTEESLSCQGIPAETCRPPPSKVHAGNDEPVIAGAEGDGQPQRRVSKEDFQLLKVIGMGAFGKVLQASDTVETDQRRSIGGPTFGCTCGPLVRRQTSSKHQEVLANSY